MYYAVVIIIALAVIFIILIRRLPEAMQDGSVSRPTKKANPGPSLWSAFTELRKSSPKAAAPITPLTPPATASTPTPAPMSATQTPTKKPWSWPKISFDRFKKPQTKPGLQKPQSLETLQSTQEPNKKDDFWSELQPIKPIEEPVASLNPLPQKEKPKGKNLFQEAEDLFAIRDYRKAERLYLRLAAEEPKNPKIYSRLGIIYLEQQNYEDARDALQQAIKLEPAIASRYFNLALVYSNLNSRAKAITALESALKYDPSNRKYRKMLDEIMSGRT